MVLEEIKVTAEFRAEMDKYRIPDKSKGLLEECSERSVIFAERMLGVRPYAWQVYALRLLEAIVNEKDVMRRAKLIKKFLALTSRQIGKSTLVAMFAAWCAVFNKYPGTIYNHSIIGIISATDVQAKKLLYEIKKILRAGDRYMEDTYQENGIPSFGKKFFSNLLDESEPNNTTTITFKPYKMDVHGPYLLKGSKSGSIIKSFPPTGIVLGETFTVLIEDEAGKSDKITDQFHNDFASPTISSTDGILILTSTPWVTSGFFYQAADPDDRFDSDYTRILFTCEAIKDENPAQYERIQKEIAELNKQGLHDVVQRAYYCRFVKGESSYFKPDAVFDLFSKELSKMDSDIGPTDMGIDYGGQTTSKTVVTVSKLIDGKIVRLFHYTYPVQQDLQLMQDVERWIKEFKVARIIPDDCPSGDFLNRQMKEKGWNVFPMNFRSEKVKKYGAFRSRLNKGEIQSYDDDELKTEMLAMEFSQGKQNTIIQHAPGYTDDIIDSFVMSTYFMIQDDERVKFFTWGDDEELTPDKKRLQSVNRL